MHDLARAPAPIHAPLAPRPMGALDRARRARSGVAALGRAGLALALGAAALAACGSDPAPTPKVVTAAEVRAFWGLNPGSCWLYRGDTEVVAEVTGPDSVSVAGRTVYLLQFRSLSGGLPREYRLDADSEPGKLLLARLTEGATAQTRVDALYQAPLPVWSTLTYDRAGALVFNEGELIETVTTPRATTENPSPMPESHRVTVRDRMKTVGTSTGSAAAINIAYERAGKTAIWNLVPNYGIALFTQDGVEHQVCAARICDAQGNCTGAADCRGALACPR
jgi:hypothetical protein